MNEMHVFLHDENTGSLAGLAVKLHFQAYRACCLGVTNVAALACNTLCFPINQCIQIVRKVNVIDICMVTSLKVVNRAFSTIFKEQLISEDSLKTLAQKKREQEIIGLKQKLEKKVIYTQFSEATAQYLYAIIPRYIGEQLNLLPPAAESWVLFKLGYFVRYLNRQLKKHYPYQEAFVTHELGKMLQKRYLGIGNQVIHSLTNKDHLNPIVDFEHLFLSLFANITMGPKKDHQKTAEAVVRSLAVSFGQQKEIEQYLNKLQLGEEEAFIARLEWHKIHHTLPKGLPDPHVVGLTKQNLSEKLDESLCQYLEEKIEKFLKRSCPGQLKRGFAGLFYFLEGKEILVKLFSYLIAELGVKQIVDPHLFALAILNGSGVEVMDYELEGFGRQKRQLILQTGQKIMADSLLENCSHFSLLKTFEESGLRCSPASLEGILQKKEAKEQLKKYISSMLHKMIKLDHFQHPESIFKTTREKVDQLPLIGAAAISLQLLINGTIFSLGYLFRNKNDNNISLPSWLFRHLSGKKLTNHLSERIVELIYHPSWRITLLQVLEALTGEDQQQHLATQNTIKENLQQIIEFLFEHFTQSVQLPFRESISSWIEHLSGDTVLNLFLESIQPKKISLLEKGLKSFLPTIKELLLYTRVISSFRKESVLFEGDAKFWEYFIREWLNQHVAIQIQQSMSNPVTLTQLFAIREQIVDTLLALDEYALHSILAKIPEIDLSLDGQPWREIDDGLEDEFQELLFDSQS